MHFTYRMTKSTKMSIFAGMLACLFIPLSLTAIAHADADDMLFDANHALETQQWSTAFELYKQFIDTYPEHTELPNAIFSVGESLCRLHRYADARYYYERLIKNFPDWPAKNAAFFRIATCFYQTQEYVSAIETLTNLISQRPKPDVLDKATYWLGEACFRAERYDEALAAYQTNLNETPNGEYAPYSLYSIATIEARSDRRAAILTFTTLLNRFPDSTLATDAIYAIGHAHEGLTEYDEAITWYTKVADRAPGSELAAHARSGIASVQVATGRQTDAAATLSAIAREYPSTEIGWKAALQAGDVLFDAHKYQAAALAYKAASALHNTPYAGIACYWQGVAHEHANAPTSALAVFEKYLATYPAGPQTGNAYVHIGGIQMAAGNFTTAKVAYDSALSAPDASPDITLRARYGALLATYRLDPTEPNFQALTDLILENRQCLAAADLALEAADIGVTAGHSDRALVMVRVITESHPQHASISQATLYAGQLLANMGHTDDAIVEFQQVLLQQADTELCDAARVGIICAHIAAENLSEAEKTLASIHSDESTDTLRSQLFYKLANAHFQHENWQAAAMYYRNAYDTAPASEWAQCALAGIGDATAAAEDYAAAVTAYKQLLTQFPSLPDIERVRLKYGIALTHAHLYKEALKEFERALEQTGDAALAAQILAEMAGTQAADGTVSTAVETYLRVSMEYPKSTYADTSIFAAAELRYRQGNFAAAMELYQRLLDDYPQSPISDEAYYKLAWTLLKTGDQQAALQHFQNAANTVGDRNIATDASIQAGYILLNCQDYTAAIQILEPAIKIAPETQLPAVLTLLAQACIFAETPDRALPLLARMHNEFAQSAYASQATLLMAKAHTMLKHYDEAIAILHETVRNGNTRLCAEAMLELGEIASLQGDFKSAAQLYRCVASAGASADSATADIAANALYMAGVSLENAGDKNGAIEVYKSLEHVYPNQEVWQKMAEERLNTLNVLY